MILSIVVIGKNEGQNLAKLFKSLKKITLPLELIYVDSASSDESATIAKLYTEHIYVLENSPQLCAAAGRYIGTKKANGKWILYLDGDMELSTEFASWINNDFQPDMPSQTAGFVGEYTYVYRDGSSIENRLLQPSNSFYADHFGGAVLLGKESVLKAGNWNPSVVANEEIDLYSRLKNQKQSVLAIHCEMVIHQAAHTSKGAILLSLFIPLNKRYYGFGQALRSQIIHNSLGSFIQLNPYPFLLWLLIFISLFIPYVTFLLVLFSLYISYVKNPHYLIVYLADFPRAIFGFLSYKSYLPEITTKDAL